MIMTQVLEGKSLPMTPLAERIISELEEVKENALKTGSNPVYSMLEYWGKQIISPNYNRFGSEDKEYIIRYISNEKLKLVEWLN